MNLFIFEGFSELGFDQGSKERISPLYLVDGMLGTTARKLRILGFDTIYDTKSNDRDLVRAALISGRTLLTSDFGLYSLAKGLRVNAILVKGTNETEKLFQVLAKSGVPEIRIGDLVSRCSLCNGDLVSTDKSIRNYGKIYSCVSCGKKYWRGSHWNRMNAFFEEVNSLLARKTRCEKIR